MKRLYRYIVACIAMLCALQQLSAQETVITDQLIYDRVSGYMVSGDVELSQMTENIRWNNDITLWYGAPGFISEGLLGNLFYGIMYDEDIDMSVSERLNDLRITRGPRYKFSTIGLSYARQLRPWFSLGVKSTFAAIWEYKCDVFTNERLYDDIV